MTGAASDLEPAAAAGAPAERLPVQVIEPATRWTALDWREVWAYRELLYFLTWRDVKVRYKQTVLGVAWAILQPALLMVVFTIFFGRLAGLGQRTGDVPYPLFVFAGLVPWTFFASAVNAACVSLVGSTPLVTKVYFPRLIVPMAAVAVALLDLVVSLVPLAALMLWYGRMPSPAVMLAPLYLLGLVMVAVGVGATAAALTVTYRDFRYLVPFLIQVWLFVTPVIYPGHLVPSQWRWALDLNPVAGLLDGFRACTVGALAPPATAGPVAMSVGVFVAGCLYFGRVERRLADVI